ncbi:MAG TPA: lectin like domain-containing protein [Phycisphaerae bacterium]|nr:lectin like domain-containing protein [Phycisphaerae bacterium]
MTSIPRPARSRDEGLLVPAGWLLVPWLLAGGAAAAAGLPATFDLRNVDGHNYVTAIRDQGPYGTCWTFGLLASPESNLLMTGNWGPNGIEYDEPNLSERHLDWWSGFNKHHNADLDPPTGDGTDIHGGGNSVYLAAYMSRGEGMVRELDAAYVDIDFAPPHRHRRFHRYYARDIDMYIVAADLSNIDVVKQNVMAKGAVSTCMCTESQFFRDLNGHKVHYQPPSDTHFINHEVAIIGWDDNMVTHAPGGPGAWLIKNSWGTGWNTPEGGFFWISYYDKFATRYPTFDGGTINIHNVVKLTAEHFYYHDYHGWVDTKTDASRAFNAFVAQGNDLLTGVSFYTAADGVTYTARIYDTFAGGQLSGQLAEVAGTIEYRGFHTVDLAAPVPVADGNDFYVYLELSAGGQPYDRSFDSTQQAMPGGGPARAIVNSSSQPGESYYWDGSAWQDLYYFTDPNWPFDCTGTTSFCMKAIALADCNGNGLADVQDIESGTSLDVNENWVPDECETRYVRYVDDNATDDPGPGDPLVSDPAEDGSAAHPFDALQEALNSLGELNGNTELVEIIVRDGTYTGFGNLDVDFYNWDYGGYRNFVVRSEHGPEHCVIDVQGDYSGWGTAFLIGGDGADEPILQGLTIANAPFAGVYCGGYASTLRDCVLSGHANALYGEPGAAPVLAGCTLEDNQLGVTAYSYHPTLRGCRVQNNMVAGIYADTARVALRGSTIAGHGGLGVDVSRGELVMTSCFVTGNLCGGVRTYNAQTSVRNCTLAANTSFEYGGGLIINGYIDMIAARVENCIVWGNTGYEDTQIAINAIRDLTLDVSHSDVQGGQAGVKVLGGAALNWAGGNIAVDPQFAAAGNGHLAPTSPCVDAGAPVTRLAIPHDLDGEVRCWDGDGDGICRPDIGADEFVQSPGDLNCDGVIDRQDINRFVAALTWPAHYWEMPGACNIHNADVNGDNQINFGDINPFVALFPRNP